MWVWFKLNLKLLNQHQSFGAKGHTWFTFEMNKWSNYKRQFLNMQEWEVQLYATLSSRRDPMRFFLLLIYFYICFWYISEHGPRPIHNYTMLSVWHGSSNRIFTCDRVDQNSLSLSLSLHIFPSKDSKGNDGIFTFFQWILDMLKVYWLVYP